jgi:hypothetical protein
VVTFGLWIHSFSKSNGTHVGLAMDLRLGEQFFNYDDLWVVWVCDHLCVLVVHGFD